MSDSIDHQDAAYHWISEKAGHVLRSGCRIADLLQNADIQISGIDREILIDSLYLVIYDSANISAFTNGSPESFNDKWADLMTYQGEDRFLEFQERVDQGVPATDPPMTLPVSLQTLSDLSNEIILLIDTDPGNHTRIRESVKHLYHRLKKTKFLPLKRLGESLEELVDRQAFENAISWDDFVKEINTGDQTLKRLLVEYIESRYKNFYAKPPR